MAEVKIQAESRTEFGKGAARRIRVVTEHPTVQVEAEATHIPENIVVSVEGLDVGAQIHASDLKLPVGTTLAIEPDTLIVNVTAAQTAEEVEEELSEAEAEAGIERDEKAEEPVAAAAE